MNEPAGTKGAVLSSTGGPGGTRTPDALLRTEEKLVENPLIRVYGRLRKSQEIQWLREIFRETSGSGLSHPSIWSLIMSKLVSNAVERCAG